MVRWTHDKGCRAATRPWSLSLALVLVALLTVGACAGATGSANPTANNSSRSTPAPGQSRKVDIESGPWPNAGETRAALTNKHGYQFTRLGSSWRMENAEQTFLISVAYQDNFVDGVEVGVYDAPYDAFQTDFDNVFAVIVPEAQPWEHEMLQRSKQADSLETVLVTSGGRIRFSWDKSIPILQFLFDGNAIPRQ
jgi:hypothetical protein